MSNFDNYSRKNGKLPHQILFLFLLALICVLSIWAYLSPLDITTEAFGRVVPSRHIQTVQHLEGGIIESIDVSEGDVVVRGDPLITLEATASAADFDQLNVRMASLRVASPASQNSIIIVTLNLN